MVFNSAFDVCRSVGILPDNLKCWQSASLITPPTRKGYNNAQLSEIRVIRALTSSGDTLSEIHTLLNHSWQYRPSGWELRRQECIIHIQYGTDETRNRYLSELYNSYCPDDIHIFMLYPIIRWLRREEMQPLRFHFINCLMHQLVRLYRSGAEPKYLHPLLRGIGVLKLCSVSVCY